MSELQDTVDDLWGEPPSDNDPTDGQLGGTPSDGRVVEGEASEGTNPGRLDSVAPDDDTGKVGDDVIRVSFIPVARFSGDVPSYRCTFDDLEATLRRDGQVVDDKDGRALVMSTFRKGDGTTAATTGRVGTFRQEALIDETWLMGLDFDTRSGDALEIASPLKAAGVDTVLYSSHSHGRVDVLREKVRKELAKKLAPDLLEREVERRAHAPRFRVLVRTVRSVTPSEYRALWAWLDCYLGGGSDDSCSDPTRLYYTPRRKAPDAELDPWIVRWRGAPLDPDKLPDGGNVEGLLQATHARSRPTLEEQKRRHREAMLLTSDAMAEAKDHARGVILSALAGVHAAAEGGRRKALFFAACRIGEWADVIGEEGVETWRRPLLDVARRLPEPDDHTRQVENGIHAGRGAPADVVAVLAGQPFGHAPSWEVEAANDDDDPEAASWRQDKRRAHDDLTMAMGTSAAVLSTPCDFVSYADLMRKNIPPVQWLVSGLLTDDAVAVVAGEPKTAKTWLALEIAVAVALGDKVMGEFQARRTGPVALFLTEDREASVKARLSSTVLGHAVDPLEVTPPIHIKARGTLDLSDDATLAWLVASIRRLPEAPRLLVIDPLRNVMGALKENDNDDMARVNAALRALRDVLGATVLYVHHTGKLTEGNAGRRPGQRMRGAGALHGGYDAGIHLSAPATTQDGRKTVMSASVEVEVKAGKAAAPFSFDLNIHDNDDGQCIRADWAHEGETRAAKGVGEVADKATAAILHVFRSKLMNYRLTKTAAAIESGGNKKARLPLVDALVAAGTLASASKGQALEVWPADCGDRCRQTFEKAWWASGAVDVGGSPFVSARALATYLANEGGQARGEVDAYLSGKHRRGDLLGEIVALGFIKAHEPGDAPDDEPGWVIVDPVRAAGLMLARLASG